ncbi:E motif [Dillenia turbinata]|uniref:E motif n=1 Tax=Dillenia turbinata TaxID=194707 RepID=A0AAN8Z9X0_9MAGN
MVTYLKSLLDLTYKKGHGKSLPGLLSNLRSEQSCNDYISSLCKQSHFKEALEAFEFLQKDKSFQLNRSTCACLVSACSSLRSLHYGRKIHQHILVSNCRPDVMLQNHMLNMYAKCGSPGDAQRLFDQMTERNVVSWTSMITAYSQKGKDSDAIRLYIQMLQSGIIPDQFTFGSIIRTCSSASDACLGRQLHVHIIKSEQGSDITVQNALITMYMNINLIDDAVGVFSQILEKDVVSWGSVIAACSQLGYVLEAVHRFKEMLAHGVYQPNEYIFGSTFSACGSLLQLEYGKQIHGMSIKFGFGGENFTGCSLSDMYAKCGFLEYAIAAFHHIEDPDLVSWNAIISGFAYGDDVNYAMILFSKLRHHNLIPDEITVRSLLCACTSPVSLCQGKQLHSYITKMGFDMCISVCNTLLTMYMKCSDLCDTFKMFEEMRITDLVSWNAILTACMQHSQAGEVLQLFKLLLHSQYEPDYITMVNILGACAELTYLEMGNQLLGYIVKTGLGADIKVTNGLIDMYIKCGSLGRALDLFDSMKQPDVVSWSSLIVGYAQFGYGDEALELFAKMRSLGIKPNQVTLVGVLTACSHVGLVEEGWQLYTTMESELGIMPTREHCSCVVDLLARSGCLNEAEEFIRKMAFDPDILVWKTLLAACKTHGNMDIGERSAENILKIDPSNSAAHVLLCNIYASSGRWQDFARLRSMMKETGVQKVPGRSWIEVKDKIHIFFAEDCSHKEREKIYPLLDVLWLHLLDAGYFPGLLCGVHTRYANGLTSSCAYITYLLLRMYHAGVSHSEKIAISLNSGPNIVSIAKWGSNLAAFLSCLNVDMTGDQLTEIKKLRHHVLRHLHNGSNIACPKLCNWLVQPQAEQEAYWCSIYKTVGKHKLSLGRSMQGNGWNLWPIMLQSDQNLLCILALVKSLGHDVGSNSVSSILGTVYGKDESIFDGHIIWSISLHERLMRKSNQTLLTFSESQAILHVYLNKIDPMK